MPEKKKKPKSALKVNKGIEQPSSINEDAVKKFSSKKITEFTTSDIVSGILSGNRTMLSKAITLVESTLPVHNNLAQEVIEKCLPYSGKSIRIGITGVPGVGKSTFIEALGTLLIKREKKVAVLTIDPSSARSKGSILGDKTRMENLANNKNAFVRPSASAGSLGGVARKTHESIILCEAAGFNTIFVETVGVGQSETAVHSLVDFFLLLMLAGAGDELQGIKRGIIEMADAIVINKADDDNIIKAGLAKQNYENALHLFPPTNSSWIPLVKTCSSISGDGIMEVWEIIENYVEQTYENNYFENNRKSQSVTIMLDTINMRLNDSFYFNDKIEESLHRIKNDLKTNKISAYVAAQNLLDKYFKELKK